MFFYCSYFTGNNMVKVQGWLLVENASLVDSIDSFVPFDQQRVAIICMESLNALVPWRQNNVLIRVMYSWFALTHVSLPAICVIVFVFISARQRQRTMLKLLHNVFCSSLRWQCCCQRWRPFGRQRCLFFQVCLLGFHHVDLIEEVLCLQTVEALSPEDSYYLV